MNAGDIVSEKDHRYSFHTEPLTVIDLFEKQVIKTPYSIAVSHKNRSLSYLDLNEDANSVAAKLISMGIGKEMLVPVCVERSIEMIIGILAIIKAGAAYVPLDPAFPDERLRYMIDDVEADHLLTTGSIARRFPETLKTILLDDSADKITGCCNPGIATGSDTAYAIYTSGSTGKPKAVLVGHAGIANYILHQSAEFNISPEDVILQTTNYAFDPSVEQIFIALCNGARLALIDKEVLADPEELTKTLTREKITHLHATPSLLLQLVPGRYGSLKRVIAGGETCPPTLARSWSAFTGFYNKYGPTEATISSTQFRYDSKYASAGFVPIGKPISNSNIYIIDEQGNPTVADGPGELCIGGKGVAKGYLKRPALTEEKFVPDPFTPGRRMYKTGDLARWLPDGNIEFIERKDDQIKINGHRVEPGEIEAALVGYSSIYQCVVTALQGGGSKRIAAYIVSKEAEDIIEIRKHLASVLPVYMVPALVIQLDALPLTANGKTDKKALPKPSMTRPESSVLYKEPTTETEKKLASVWREVLQLERIGTDDNFFDLGGSSLLAVKAVVIAKETLGFPIPVTLLYEHLTIHALASSLDKKNSGSRYQQQAVKPSPDQHSDIAVIGMAGRFPGANTIEELWRVLCDGRETIRFFGNDEIDPSVPDSIKNDPSYVKARGVIDRADEFDPAFFGINPKLAQLMDPQHRVFLEIAWEALEAAGCIPNKYDGRIGVFAGCRNNMYYYTNVLSNTELVEKVGSFQVMTANEKDYLATRTAFSLDLKGPAVNVQSACSTSLLAIVQAVQSIRSGQCEMALAGAAAIALPINSGYLYQEGSMLSNDGHCRPFDADAKGTIFCDGAGVVLLKSRAQAEKDGDLIYAFIKGIGVNNDGGVKSSFTAPSVSGQAGAITMALEDAGVDPLSISYIEAHGTATPLGDPIEIEALHTAYGRYEKKQFCALGSIKSNLGHLTVASGAAGFIKAVLSLYHQKLAPTIFYNRANPNIDFGNGNFYVNTTLKHWEADGLRRAGVSAFGVGGTNVHIILEESEQLFQKRDAVEKPQLVCWSGKTETSRDSYSVKLRSYLEEHESATLASLAFNFHLHKENFNSRRFIVAANKKDLIEKLALPPLATEKKLLKEKHTGIIFMFPGQGSQYVNMGKELYMQEPVFREAAEECFALLEENIRDIIYSADALAREKLRNTRYAQPALFVIEYATAKLWMSWGVLPAAFIGHSIGELVAAHLAGIFTLADALKLISARGRLMSEQPPGSMLSVRCEAEKVKQFMPDSLSLAAVNSPALCVVAGAADAVSGFAEILNEREIASSLLHTSHAFHSLMMEPVVAPFRSVVESITLNKPSIPIVSTVTGKWLRDDEAMSANYWADHLIKTVRFSDAVAQVLNDPNYIFLEAGPMNITATLTRQQTSGHNLVVHSFEPLSKGKSEYETMLHALGQLWLNGATPDWKSLYSDQEQVRINDLPTYAFDRKRYWVNPKVAGIPAIDLGNIEPKRNGYHKQEIPLRGERITGRRELLTNKITRILQEASGIEIEAAADNISFIEMGLDSLSLTQIAITVKKEFDVPISFRQLNESYNNISLLAAYIDDHRGQASGNEQSQKEALRAGTSPLTTKVQLIPAVESQVEIFAACLLGGQNASCSYNQSVWFQLSGEFNQQAMENALQDLTAKHEALTATFSADGKHLIMNDPFIVPVHSEDLSAKSESEQLDFLERFSLQYSNTPFDLLNGPLFKAVIFKLSENEHSLALMGHHIVCDGWSFSILIEDLSVLYSGRVSGEQVGQKKAESFSSFALEQQDFYKSDHYKKNGTFWADLYKKDVPVLSMPTDFYRPSLRTYPAQRDVFQMDKQLLEEIKKKGAELGCSFVTTLLSAFQFYVHQLTGQDKIIIGLPVAGQPATGHYRLIGHCVNLLPIRSVIERSTTFTDFLKQQKSHLLDAFDHQLYTFGSLLRQLPLHRDPSRIPLVPVVFNFDTGMDNKVRFHGLTHKRHSKGRSFENFEIFLNLIDTEDALSLEWSFNTRLFKPSTIRQMMDGFERVLRAIAENALVSIENMGDQFNTKTNADLFKWNSTSVDYPREKPVYQLLAEQAARTPGATAVRSATGSISYRELQEASNRFAALLKSVNIQHGDNVGVALDRSPDLIVALLGILKSGAAYVPLDPAYPKDRIEFMLQDSRAKILLTSAKYSSRFVCAAKKMLMEEALINLRGYPAGDAQVNVTGSDLAYILYTSGSTGRPKGVRIEHHNLVNFLCSMEKDLSVTAADHFLAITTISFDISGLELYLPLVCGASVTIADADTVRDGRLLLNLINKEKPDVVQATPSTWQMLLEAGLEDRGHIKTICCGGEAITRELTNKLLERCDALYNLYGPTETTIWSTIKKIEQKDEVITIGRPIDNTQVYILNECMERVAKGAVGEIYIGGEGVARGYHDRPDLTAERFVNNPFSADKTRKIYKTGDTGRFLSNGEIQCLGRADHQVKIRGYRIEPEEIQHCLTRNRLVKQAVVVAADVAKNDQRLVAYIVARDLLNDQEADALIRSLRHDVGKQLPAYMIPNNFVILPALPFTPNGKIDRNALPAPTINVQKAAMPAMALSNEEKIVEAIWKEVLGLSEIGVDEDFFELGGHSMIAVQMMTNLEKKTGIHLPLATLFEQSTIKKLASFLKKEDKAVAWNCLVTIKGTGTKAPLYIIHGIGGSAPFVNTRIRDFDADQPIYGIQARGLNGNGEIVETVEEMASLYIRDILNQNPSGPYALAGYSFGGFIAYEMAQQLKAMGKEVRMLGILDTYSGLAYYGNSKAERSLKRLYHTGRRIVFNVASFIDNPKEKIAFEKDEIKKKTRVVYYSVLKLIGRKRINYFYFKTQIAKNNYAALRKYKLKPFDGTVTLFRSRNRTYYFPDFNNMGWDAFAKVQTFEIPGEHNTIFSPRNEAEVVKVLQNRLDELANK